MSKKFRFLFFALFLLASCVETVVVGTVAASAIILSDGTIFDLSQDGRIKSSIIKTFKEDSNKDGYENIEVNVFSGKVMLTGYVNNPTYKTAAVRKARSIKPDIEVIDEIMVFNHNYKLNSVNDSWISSQISIKMKATSGITSGNYEYDVIDGTVFIIGVANNKKELEKVCDLISRVKGVKKVISYITLVAN